MINNSFPAWKQHIRLHPEMYIGSLGDSSMPEKGIYRLVKEVLDDALIYIRESQSNSLIEVSFNDRQITIRYEGFSLHPIDWLMECVSERKHDGIGFDISLVDPLKHYGVGLKVVNLLSEYFLAHAIVDEKNFIVEFERGIIFNKTYDKVNKATDEAGTDLNSGFQVTLIISFIPDSKIFGDFHFVKEYVENICLDYMTMDKGLEINIAK